MVREAVCGCRATFFCGRAFAADKEGQVSSGSRNLERTSAVCSPVRGAEIRRDVVRFCESEVFATFYFMLTLAIPDNFNLVLFHTVYFI